MNKRIFWIIISLMALFFAIVISNNFDFHYFYNAANNLTHGISPYQERGYFNPVWVSILFIPYTAFPLEIALRIHTFLSILIYCLAIIRISQESRETALIYGLMGGVFVFLTASFGNMEYMVILGMTLPTPIGIFLVLSKPQMGMGVAVLMMWSYWQQSHSKALILGVIVATFTGISFALGMGQVQNVNPVANVSPFPYGLILGIPLMGYSLWRKSKNAALAGTTLCSPYFTALSWIAVVPFICEIIAYLIPRIPVRSTHTHVPFSNQANHFRALNKNAVRRTS